MNEHPLSIQVERSIYSVRGAKVMLAPNLADLYEVETKTLNRAAIDSQATSCFSSVSLNGTL